MPRIRTIKPEFWDSPSTARASSWARLLFIALWNWADDYGRGTANMKELEGFAFPNDDSFTNRSGNTVHFRDLVAEVSECFGVVFYTVHGRPFYEIPSWDEHQRNERRSKESKYPSSQVSDAVAEIPCKRTEAPNISGPGTGEQGNRGTGEQGNSVAGLAPDAPPEPAPSPRKKSRRPIPDDWTPNDSHVDYANERDLNLDSAVETFRNHALANDRRLVDWDAGFRGWLAKEKPRPRGGAARPSQSLTFDEQRHQANNELFARMTTPTTDWGDQPWNNDSRTRQLPR